MSENQSVAVLRESDKFIANIPNLDIKETLKWRSLAKGYIQTTLNNYRASTLSEVQEDRNLAYQSALKAREIDFYLVTHLGRLIQKEQNEGRLASQSKSNTQFKKNGYENETIPVKTLSDYGITAHESSQAQRLAEHEDAIKAVIAKAEEIKDVPTFKDIEKSNKVTRTCSPRWNSLVSLSR
jgi:hypothetical protein